jgi:hypothetical protein
MQRYSPLGCVSTAHLNNDGMLIVIGFSDGLQVGTVSLLQLGNKQAQCCILYRKKPLEKAVTFLQGPHGVLRKETYQE